MTDVMGDDNREPIGGSARNSASDPIHVPAAVPVTKLWTGFVLGWLLVLIAAVVLLVQDRAYRPRLPVALVGLTLVGVLYLVTTLRYAIGPTDLVSGRPDARALRRRTALLAAMALLVFALVLLL